MTSNNKQKPCFEARIGTIRLALWDNQTADGRHWYSAAPTRRYFPDANSKEAKYASTFNGVADLVLLREAINQAIDFLKNRAAEANGQVEEE